MADPVTLATIAIVGSAASSAVAAGGAIYSGYAQSSMYKYQAGVANVNAKIAKQNAEYSRSIGEFKAEQSGMKTRQQMGKIITTEGASGFRVGEGSSKDIQESVGMLGRSEQDVIRSDAARAAYGHEVEALNFEAQSGLYSMAAKKSVVEGYLGAGESILGGASSTSSKWLQYSTTFG